MIELGLNTFTSVILGTIVFFLIRYIRRPHGKFPPGPTGYPIIGNLLEIRSGKPVEAFLRLRKQYGDVFCLDVFNRYITVISGRETIRDALIKHADLFSDRPPIPLFKDFFQNKGLLASSGEFWKHTRTFSLTTLRDFGFGRRSLEGKILEEVEIYIQCIESQEPTMVDLHRITHVCVSNVICSIVFGKRFEHSDQRFLHFMDLLEQVQNTNPFLNLAGIFRILRYLPGNRFGQKSLYELFQEVDVFLSEIIENHRKDFDENDIKDVTDAFLKEQIANKEDEIYQNQNMKIVLLNLFLAGTFTTQIAIRWAILHLLHNPDVLKRMTQEIETVIGFSRPPSMNDKSNMPYTQAVMAETLRLGTPAPIAPPHGSDKEIPYKDFIIPAGSMVMFNLYSANVDPVTFKEPLRYNPSRYLDQHGNLSGHERDVMTFGAGRRACLGEALARMELFLFLTSVVQRFEVRPTKGIKLPDMHFRDPNEPGSYIFTAMKRV